MVCLRSTGVYHVRHAHRKTLAWTKIYDVSHIAVRASPRVTVESYTQQS